MRSIIIFVLFTAAIKTSAQINIICPRLTDSTLNYFYIGVDNPIEIVGIKMTTNHKIVISGEGSTVFSGKESKYTPGNSIFAAGENRYIVRTNTYSDSCFIRIYKGKKEIFRKQFKTRKIPDLDVTLGGLRDTTVSKSRILANPIITLSCKDCYYRHNIQIVSFVITVAIKDSVVSASAEGNGLSDKQIELIKNADNDGLITVENIRALLPEGRQVKLPSIIIYYRKSFE